VLALTRGTPLSLTQLISTINPMDHLFTGIYETENGSSKSIGQIYQAQELAGAQLNFLLPGEVSSLQGLVPLLEGLIKKVGHWGAKYITADLAVDSDLLPHFRQAGFSVLAKQRVFRCTSDLQNQETRLNKWRLWTNKDIWAIRNLHSTLVPPIMQPVEPLTRRKMLGLVYFDDEGELKAYADLVYGPSGAWVLPFLHPQTREQPLDLLCSLLDSLPERNNRAVYFVARSYQPWLENALNKSTADPGPEQALLVRYLALRQQIKVEFSYGSLENGNREPTIPLAPIKNNHD
jgi:hypothetical protein